MSGWDHFLVLGLVILTLSAWLRSLHRTVSGQSSRLTALESRLDDVRTARDVEAILAPRRAGAPPLREYIKIHFRPSKALEDVLTPDELRLWKDQNISFPTVAIERWRGHIAVETTYEQAGERRVKRQMLFPCDRSAHLTLWEVRLGDDPGFTGMLYPRVELQLDTRNDSLVLGPFLGRFGETDCYDHLRPRAEFLWADIDLRPSSLARHRSEHRADAGGEEHDSDEDELNYCYTCTFAPGGLVEVFVKVHDLERFDTEVRHALATPTGA